MIARKYEGKKLMKLTIKSMLGSAIVILIAWALIIWSGHRNVSKEVHFVSYVAGSKTFADQILRDIPSLSKSEVDKLRAYYDPAQQSINSLIGTIIYCQKNHYDCMSEIQPIYEKFRDQYNNLQLIRKKFNRVQMDFMEDSQQSFMKYENKPSFLNASMGYLKDIQKIINEPYEESAKQLKKYEWRIFPNLEIR